MENRKIIYFLLFKAPVESSLQFLPVPSPIPHQKKKNQTEIQEQNKKPFSAISFSGSLGIQE